MRVDRPNTYQWRNASWEVDKPDLGGFEAWLVHCGATIEGSFPNEVLRFKAVNHIGLVYVNKRGKNRFVHCAGPLYKAYKSDEILDLRPMETAYPNRPLHGFEVMLPYTGWPRRSMRWCEMKRGWETLEASRLVSFTPWDVYLDGLDGR